jgi:hypothetical protein
MGDTTTYVDSIDSATVSTHPSVITGPAGDTSELTRGTSNGHDRDSEVSCGPGTTFWKSILNSTRLSLPSQSTKMPSGKTKSVSYSVYHTDDLTSSTQWVLSNGKSAYVALSKAVPTSPTITMVSPMKRSVSIVYDPDKLFVKKISLLGKTISPILYYDHDSQDG